MRFPTYVMIHFQKRKNKEHTKKLGIHINLQLDFHFSMALSHAHSHTLLTLTEPVRQLYLRLKRPWKSKQIAWVKSWTNCMASTRQTFITKLRICTNLSTKGIYIGLDFWLCLYQYIEYWVFNNYYKFIYFIHIYKYIYYNYEIIGYFCFCVLYFKLQAIYFNSFFQSFFFLTRNFLLLPLERLKANWTCYCRLWKLVAGIELNDKKVAAER